MAGIRGNYCGACGKHFAHCSCGEACSAAHRQGAASATPPSPSTASQVGELPPLPKAHEFVVRGIPRYVFTADQMNDRYREGYRAALAAKTAGMMEKSGAEDDEADERDYCALYAIRIQEHDGTQGYWMIGMPGAHGTWMTRDDGSWVGPTRHVVEWHRLVDPERSVLGHIPEEGASNAQPSTGEVDVEAERGLPARIQAALDLLADAKLPSSTWRDVSNVLHACRDALAARRTQAEGARDAERYRWVCEHPSEELPESLANILCSGGRPSKVDIDHAIDAAIAATQKGRG